MTYKVPRKEWQNCMVDEESAHKVCNFAVARGDITQEEDGNFYLEVIGFWTMGIVTDYIGNRITFEQAKRFADEIGKKQVDR